jgi:hypothetical protein
MESVIFLDVRKGGRSLNVDITQRCSFMVSQYFWKENFKELKKFALDIPNFFNF